MAITHIFAQGFGFGQNGGTTPAIDTTGCDFFWAGMEGEIAGSTPTISDSKGNTWHSLTLCSSGVGFTGAIIFWCVPTSVGTGHTFTFVPPQNAGSFPGCFIAGAHGVDQSSPLDHDAGNPGFSASSNTWTPGVAGCLVVGHIANFTGNVTAVTSPLTLDVHQPLTGGTNYDGAIAHVIQTTAVSVTATFTGTLSGRQTVAAASFKPAVSATNIPIPLATMAMTEYAPGLVRVIPVPVRTMAFTEYAPTLGTVIVIGPVPKANLALATFAPTLIRSIPIPVRTLGFTTFAPVVTPVVISIPAAHLTTATFAPLVEGTTAIQVPTGSLLIDTFAPTVIVANLGACAERFGPKLYYWEPSYLERPEDTFLRATDWENAGYQGLKFVQGFILEADTEGDTRQIMIQGDQNDVELITINHAGQQQKPYSLNAPIQVHLLRILPMDTSVHWRLFHVRWVYEPAPEFAKEWKTQGTDHDIPGFMFLKDVYIAHNSTQDITLNITVDGALFTYTIPNSGGVFKKDYLLLALANSGLALKGTLFTYELTSPAPFQLFQRDCEVRVHAWAGGDYLVKLPFGDISRVNGARI